jgi:hypothetical protein
MTFKINKLINFRKFGFVEDNVENLNNSIYQTPNCFFDIAVYENVGKALLISFLDIFEKNPYSRIENTKYKKISSIRKEIATNLINLDRFKKNPQNFKKLRNIDEAAYENFFQHFQTVIFCFYFKIENLLKKKVFEVSENNSAFINNFKSHTQEEKKILVKSNSFRDKDAKTVIVSFKTPGKKTIAFHSKMDNFQIKSESNLAEDEKNEIWEKGKENEDLINELKEELEEEIDDSDLSCDSEEINDDEVKEYSIGKSKTNENPISPNLKKNVEKSTKINKDKAQ